MTDLQTQLVAAIQQVRARTPHVAPCYYAHDLNDLGAHVCTCSRDGRVDARLAACVEASWHVAIARCIENVATGDYVPPKKAPAIDAGLAAFLAAAAQEETTT